jgi:hypothetical protein
MVVNETDLITIFARLYHAADRGAWQSIRRHGLLSTSWLLDLYQIRGEQRIAFESQRRHKSMALTKRGYDDIALRDQNPMTDEALNRCLVDGMTPRQWYESLNAKVFFWTSKRRLQGLLTAKATRETTQLVLTVDTRSLVSGHRDRILLSGLNSGSTIRKPLPRGARTFLPISDFPYQERRKSRSASDALVELVVAGGVPDLMDHLIAAHEVTPGQSTEIWRRPGSDPGEGPLL